MLRRRGVGMLWAMLLALPGCQREPTSTHRDAGHPPEALVQPLAEDIPSQPRSLADPREGKARLAEPAPDSTSRLRTDAWEFGIISPATELRHRYTIRNDSASTWTIKNVTWSCPCTVGDFTARTVKPSESTSLEVVYRAGNHDGPVYEAVMVDFAESTAPLFNLVIRGEVRGLLSPSPSRLDLGRVSAGARLIRSIDLRNYSEQDITITTIEAPDWLQVGFEPAPSSESDTHNRPRQTWKITVRADVSKFRGGAEASVLTVRTNDARIGPIVIPVTLEIRPLLEVVPNTLDFHDVPLGGIAQQAVMLDVSNEFGELTAKDLLLAHNLGEELEIQIFKMAAQNRFRLMGIFRPKRTRGAIRGELEIKTRGQSVPPVRVPVLVHVR